MKVHVAADIDTLSHPENITATGHRNAWSCVCRCLEGVPASSSILTDIPSIVRAMS